jgi:hypothetical protein
MTEGNEKWHREGVMQPVQLYQSFQTMLDFDVSYIVTLSVIESNPEGFDMLAKISFN